MKRIIAFGAVVILFVLQAQTVFAQYSQTANLRNYVRAGNAVDAKRTIEKKACIKNIKSVAQQSATTSPPSFTTSTIYANFNNYPSGETWVITDL